MIISVLVVVDDILIWHALFLDVFVVVVCSFLSYMIFMIDLQVPYWVA